MKIVPSVSETTDWGLDHGAWPMLMHLFPDANIPVFQLSIDYYAKPEYHYELGKQLKSLRNKGVLIIGSGALIHNLQLAGQKMRKNDKGGLGIVQIEARIKMMEGIFDLKSSKATGTRIFINIPIPEDY